MGDVRRGLKVLIVDDEPDLARTCARLLERIGYVPLVTGNGQEAIELIDREQPDVVLTDLRLPTVDGLEVLRHARRGARKIPVVLFTAYTSHASRHEALEGGAAVYLPKPFSAAALRGAIEQALTGGSGRTAGPSEPRAERSRQDG